MRMMHDQQKQMQATLRTKATKHFKHTELETVLKKLMLPSNKIVERGVEVFVPDVCYFVNGEPQNCFFNKDTNVRIDGIRTII